MRVRKRAPLRLQAPWLLRGPAWVSHGAQPPSTRAASVEHLPDYSACPTSLLTTLHMSCTTNYIIFDTQTFSQEDIIRASLGMPGRLGGQKALNLLEEIKDEGLAEHRHVGIRHSIASDRRLADTGAVPAWPWSAACAPIFFQPGAGGV